MVATTLLAHDELARRGLLSAAETIVAGHSVGEIAAYAIAGVISADDAVRLAAVRGAEMAKACAAEPTGMSAVLGGDEAEVLARLEALELIPANRNAAGQIVAAGAVAALEKLAEDPPAKARVRALATAGAFHTHYMASALDGYAAAAAGVSAADPRTTLLSNADGQPVTSGSRRDGEARRPADPPGALGSLHRDHPGAQHHGDRRVPPAGALTGIAKRELRGVATHAVKTPADLDGLTEL